MQLLERIYLNQNRMPMFLFFSCCSFHFAFFHSIPFFSSVCKFSVGFGVNLHGKVTKENQKKKSKLEKNENKINKNNSKSSEKREEKEIDGSMCNRIKNQSYFHLLTSSIQIDQFRSVSFLCRISFLFCFTALCECPHLCLVFNFIGFRFYSKRFIHLVFVQTEMENDIESITTKT